MVASATNLLLVVVSPLGAIADWEVVEPSSGDLDDTGDPLDKDKHQAYYHNVHLQVLEKDIEKLEQTHEKLSSAESEIRTLKTFLTTKTALIEKHKKDLRETRLKVAELEEKDARRAVILADVLEKTARQYQQQIGRSPLSGRGSPKLRRYQVAESQTSYLDEPRLIGGSGIYANSV